MSLTFAQARDDILTLFHSAWDPRPADYPDVAFDLPSADVPWARVALRHAPGGQATLTGADGRRTFRREGTLFVQIFTPVGNGLQDSYALAKLIADAYEGSSTPGGVWFRDVSISEDGGDGNFQQMNVSITFTYDEIK